MGETSARREKLGLSEGELAFYDALVTNDSAVEVLGDETLRAIALELVETVRTNATIDWAVRERVKVGMGTQSGECLESTGTRRTSRPR